MASQLSPFVEANYGWPYGSSAWNLEMDANLVKFSYLHDRNIDSIVSSLPAISNGSAYFNTSDNRLYFDVGGQRYSSNTPKWFIVTLRSSGQAYQFDGTKLNKGISEVSPEMFGAIGDLIADDTVAVQAALNTGKKVNLNSLYRITGTLTSTGQLIEGQGNQTGFVFENLSGANGIVFTPVSVQTTSSCHNMAIYAKGTDGGKAISTPASSVQYTTLRSSFQWSKLLISGWTKPTPGTNNAFETIETWQCGIEQGDAWNIGISEVDGYGSYRSDTNPAVQVQSCFIRLNAANAMLTAHITAITCSNYYRGIEIGDRCFFQISNFDIAHSYDGIYQTGTTVFGESKVIHGNINAQHRGIYFANIGTREISGVVTRRHRFGWKGAAYNWCGIELQSCSYVWLTDCQIAPDESDGAFTGTHDGLLLVAGGGVAIQGMTINPGLDFGIRSSNSTMLTIDNTRSFQNEATDVIFRMEANTRTSRIQDFVKVSTFIGTDYTDDGTITPGSVQQYQRNVIPESTAPTYFFRRSTSGSDEKIWKWVTGATSMNLQLPNDIETTNTNALIINRSGLTTPSWDIRTTQLKLNNGPSIFVVSGSPEGVTTAPVGSQAWRINGGAVTTFYVKETGVGNTGWVAK